MCPFRTLALIPTTAIVLMSFAFFSNTIVAQQAVYGDSDSFRGIEEQARRRSKAAAAEGTAAIEAKHIADVKQISAESSAQWENLRSAFRQLIAADTTGIGHHSGLPVYLQRQQLEIAQQDLNRFYAEEKSLMDFNTARIEYATLLNQQQNLQQLRDAREHEAAARQAKKIEEKTRTYNAALDRLKASRATASNMKENRDNLVASYNQSLSTWKDARSSVSSGGGNSSSDGFGGSGGDDYDLGAALRDRLQGLNSGYGH